MIPQSHVVIIYMDFERKNNKVFIFPHCFIFFVSSKRTAIVKNSYICIDAIYIMKNIQHIHFTYIIFSNQKQPSKRCKDLEFKHNLQKYMNFCIKNERNFIENVFKIKMIKICS